MVGGGLTMGSSPGSSVASPRGRGARSSSFLSLFYLSILAFRAFTLSIALTSRSRALSFSLLVAISRHPLSLGSWPSVRVFRDQEVKFALGSKCRLRMRMGVGMLGCRAGWVGGESGSEQRHRTQNRGRNGYTKMKAEMTVIWLVCTQAPHSWMDPATDNIYVAEIREHEREQKRTISPRQQFSFFTSGCNLLSFSHLSPSNCLFLLILHCLHSER